MVPPIKLLMFEVERKHPLLREIPGRPLHAFDKNTGEPDGSNRVAD
jgi:hypothetical protein